MTRRNSLFFLLEIYEFLDQPRTFYEIRSKTGIGFNTLNKLMGQLERDDLVRKVIIEEKEKYQITENLINMFRSSFYDTIKRLNKSDKK